MSKYFVLEEISPVLGPNTSHFALVSLSFLAWHSKCPTVDSCYLYPQPCVPFGTYTHNALLPPLLALEHLLHLLCFLLGFSFFFYFPPNKLHLFFKNQLKRDFMCYQAFPRALCESTSLLSAPTLSRYAHQLSVRFSP